MKELINSPKKKIAIAVGEKDAEERFFKDMKILAEMSTSEVAERAKWIFNATMIALDDRIYIFPRIILEDGIGCIGVQEFSRDGRHKTEKLKIILRPDKEKGEFGYEDARAKVIDGKIYIGFSILYKDTYRGALVSYTEEDILNNRWDKVKWHARPLLKRRCRGPEIVEVPGDKIVLMGRVPGTPEGIPTGPAVSYSDPVEKDKVDEAVRAVREKDGLVNPLFHTPKDWSYGGPCPFVYLRNGLFYAMFHAAKKKRIKVDIYKLKIPGEKKEIRIGLQDGTFWWEDDAREDGWNDSRNIRVQGMLDVKPENRSWSKDSYTLNNIKIRSKTYTIRAYIEWGKGSGKLKKITLIKGGKEEKIDFERSKEKKKENKHVYSIWSSIIKWNGKKFEVLWRADKPFLDGVGIYGQISHTTMLIGAVLSEDKKKVIAAVTVGDRDIRIVEIKISDLVPEKFLPKKPVPLS